MLNSYFQDVLKDLCHHESPFLSRYRRVGHNLVQGMNILMYFFLRSCGSCMMYALLILNLVKDYNTEV